MSILTEKADMVKSLELIPTILPYAEVKHGHGLLNQKQTQDLK